jgi:hypothetical protein
MIFFPLESGSFSYLRNSVCKYIRNSAEFREIPGSFTAKIPYVFQKIPYSVGSQKRTSVDTLVGASSGFRAEAVRHERDISNAGR